MASYDANINLKLNAGAVERELNKLESRLNKLSEASIGPRTGASRAAEAFIPTKALNVAQRELNNIVNRANTAEKAFARLFEGISTAGLTGAGLENVNEILKNLAVSTGNVQQGFAEMNEAGRTVAQILVPGFKDLDNFSRMSAASVNSLQFKLQSILDSSQGIREFVQNFFTLEGGAASATAAIALLATVIEGQLSESLYDIEQVSSKALGGLAEDVAKGSSELQRLIAATQGTVAQYEHLERIGKERLANVNVESDEARRATNTIVTAQELLNDALKEQNQLLEDANNLRANAKKRTSDWNDEVQQALARKTQGQVSPADPFGITDEQINQTLNARAALLEEAIEKAAVAEVKARKEVADLEKQYTRENRQRAFDALEEEFNAKMEALKKVDDIKKQQFDAEIEAFDKALAAREEINKAASEGIQTRKDVEDKIARIQKNYQQELGEIKSRQRLEDLKERQKIEDKVFNDKIRKAEQEGKEFDKELKRRDNARKQASRERVRRRRRFGEDLALGAGFPLLTGAGPGGVLGGVAGAIAGGGGGGFGLQIIFSALGSLVDQVVGSIAKLGTALNPLTLNIDALVKASGKAGTATGKLLNSLKGQISNSRLAQLAAEQLAVTIGDEGVAALGEFGEAATEFGREFSKAFSAIAAAAAPLFTGLARPVTEGIERQRLLSRANELSATDPQIAQLQKQRSERSGLFLGGSVIAPDSKKQLEIEDELVRLVKNKEIEEQKVVDAKLASVNTGYKEIEVLEMQNRLKKLGGDLLDEQVASLTENILRKEALNEQYALGVKLANDDLTAAQYKIEYSKIEARLKGKLLDLENDINDARETAAEKQRREADRAAREAERKQRELERAQRATKNLQIEVGVAKNILAFNKELTRATLERNDAEIKNLKISKVLADLGGKLAKIDAEKLSATDKQLKIDLARLDAEIQIQDINTQDAIRQRDEAEERKKSLDKVLGGLRDEIDLIDAKLTGNLEEVSIRQEVKNLTEDIAQNTATDAENVERLVRRLRERQKLEEAFNIKQQTRFAGAGLQAGFIGQAGQAFEQELIRGGTRQEAANIAQLTQQMELAQLQATALEDAVLGIGNAFATAMTTGVSELIAGTKSAQEVFADFLKNVGDALLQAATQMIATYIAIGIAKTFAGLGGVTQGAGTDLTTITNKYGDFGASGAANAAASLPPLKATGGPVTNNMPYIVGEEGPELFVPGANGTILPNDETRRTLAQQNINREENLEENGEVRQTRELARIREVQRTREQLDRQQEIMQIREDREVEKALGSPRIKVDFDSQVINNVEYVTADQHRRGMAQAAEQGRALTLQALQNSVRSRRKVGLA